MLKHSPNQIGITAVNTGLLVLVSVDKAEHGHKQDQAQSDDKLGTHDGVLLRYSTE
jgi:hypothetical protein